jgi:hypothetical protein
VVCPSWQYEVLVPFKTGRALGSDLGVRATAELLDHRQVVSDRHLSAIRPFV